MRLLSDFLLHAFLGELQWMQQHTLAQRLTLKPCERRHVRKRRVWVPPVVRAAERVASGDIARCLDARDALNANLLVRQPIRQLRHVTHCRSAEQCDCLPNTCAWQRRKEAEWYIFVLAFDIGHWRVSVHGGVLVPPEAPASKVA